MVTEARMGKRPNAIRKELSYRATAEAQVPADAVYATIAELSNHPKWSEAQGEGSGLTSFDAPAGLAGVGTEFASTGRDPMSVMTDRSVVTEATRPTTFEFVTDSAMELKRSGKRSGWTLVHRYEIEPRGAGCEITATTRVVRINALPGAFALMRIPGMRAVMRRSVEKDMKAKLGAIARYAEENARS